jgi:hypothetical protein
VLIVAAPDELASGSLPEPEPEPIGTVVVPAAALGPAIPTRSAVLASQPAPPPRPVRVALPTIGVEAPVEAVGVDRDGELDVPASSTVAGWYRGGPAPTDPSGSAVIAAHVDHRGRPGAFFRLAELRPGDPIEVTAADGTSSTFAVVSTTSYRKADLPIGEVFRRAGDPVLTLITCGGAFRPDRGSYADNVVVRATPVVG